MQKKLSSARAMTLSARGSWWTGDSIVRKNSLIAKGNSDSVLGLLLI